MNQGIATELGTAGGDVLQVSGNSRRVRKLSRFLEEPTVIFRVDQSDALTFFWTRFATPVVSRTAGQGLIELRPQSFRSSTNPSLLRFFFFSFQMKEDLFLTPLSPEIKLIGPLIL